MNIRYLIGLWILLLSIVSYSQSDVSLNPWAFQTPTRNAIKTKHTPLKGGIQVVLDTSQLINSLKNAPLRNHENIPQKSTFIELPLPNGQFQTFSVLEASILPQKLLNDYPNIRSFVGYGIDDPTAYARFDWSPNGLHGIILSAKYGTTLIDPTTKNNQEQYTCYFKKNIPSKSFSCEVFNESPHYFSKNITKNRSAGDCQFRTYRLAVACTAEYTAYHGGTVADALAAINTTVTRINAVFENDLAISFRLVPENTDIIFLNPNTDPFPSIASNGGFDGNAMLEANQQTIDAIVGSNNYDVGHLFITGLGGVAGLGVACGSQEKAIGLSGLDIPEGSFFDIDIVAHELGHQFGASHSFNGMSGSCAGNTSFPSAMEPGSGTTIMSYAGLCESQNVENSVDAYFHAISLEEIARFIENGGSNCAQVLNTANEPPTASVGPDYYIPIGTPFVLTGSGTDENGDALSYTWEQMDNGTTAQPPVATATRGPVFRSFPPSNSPTRYFPNLPDLANNRNTTWEVLPTVGRDLNFRFTVRDNAVNGGCTAEDDVRLIVDENAGPFEVIESENESWIVGTNQTVLWNVAGTTNDNVNASTVDILLSTDGGFTFPIIVAEGIPNNGMANIIVPNTPTTTARFMVKGHNHVFFDISNENLAIAPILNDFVVQINQPRQIVCNEQEALYEIAASISGVALGNINFSTQALPDGITATFSDNDFRPPGNSTLRLMQTSDIAAGTYDFQLIITTQRGVQTLTLQLIIQDESTNIVALRTPPNNSVGIGIEPTFQWTSVVGASNYIFQLSTTRDFNNVIANIEVSNTSLILDTPLDSNTRYYWRVSPINECSNGTPNIFTFLTANIVCTTFESGDLPQTISPIGNSSVTSIITIPDNGSILDLNINNIEIDHTFISDISIGLISPMETIAILAIELCTIEEDMFLSFDDEAENSYGSIPCPPTTGESYMSVEALSIFDGEDIQGDWSLVVLDQFDEDGGSLDNWSIEVCYLEPTTTLPLSISIDKLDETCAAAQDGMAMVATVGGVPPFTYRWSNGATIASIEALSPGIYSVTVSDSLQTTVIDSVEIVAADSINVIFSITEPSDFEATDGQIRLIIENTTNISQFEWFFNDELISNEQDIDGLIAGDYSLIIRDTNDCTYQYEFTLDLSVSTEDLILNNQIRITPNPTAGQFQLSWTTISEAISITVFNANGELLLTIPSLHGINEYSMDLSNYPKGIYLVRLQTLTEVALRRVIVL